MNEKQVTMIRDSWNRLAPHGDDLAQDFYLRLFAAAPEVRPLFKRDVQQQGRMLTTVIGLAVRGLDRIETLVPMVRDLGKRHALYGVRDEQYELVGAILLETFSHRLGGEFTVELHAAWTEAYGFLAQTMIEGACEVRQAVAA